MKYVYELLKEHAMHLFWGVIYTYLRTGPTRWSGRFLPSVHFSLITSGVFKPERTFLLYLQSVTANLILFKPVLTLSFAAIFMNLVKCVREDDTVSVTIIGYNVVKRAETAMVI